MESEYRSVGLIESRYEDIAQDGRPLLDAIPPSLGAVWRATLVDHEDAPKIRAAGAVPILSRIEIDLTEHSFSAMGHREVEGFATMFEGTNAEEDHARVLLDIRTRIFAKTGHAMLPYSGPRERKEMGRLLGEHVLTRLFADKGKRRVSPDELRAKGVTMAGSRPWARPQSIVDAPENATPIDLDFVRDATPIAFGLTHTDANQHVNSLVYPRLFEEAVLRRLLVLGRKREMLARRLAIGWRRPSFAGEVARFDLRLYENGDRIIALGMLFGEDESERARARAYIRLDLTR